MGFKKFIRRLFGIKESIVPYPSDFLIIEYSPIALKHNILNDQNKVIYRYNTDEFGNVNIRRYRYSIPRLKSLIDTHMIPVFDKTRQEKRFPIFGKILPGEVEVER